MSNALNTALDEYSKEVKELRSEWRKESRHIDERKKRIAEIKAKKRVMMEAQWQKQLEAASKEHAKSRGEVPQRTEPAKETEEIRNKMKIMAEVKKAELLRRFALKASKFITEDKLDAAIKKAIERPANWNMEAKHVIMQEQRGE